MRHLPDSTSLDRHGSSQAPALNLRSEQGGRVDNLDEVDRVQSDASALALGYDPSRAIMLNNLVDDLLNNFRQLGKAGRSRWLNIRPTVRGLAMNAADHPHGGGRGKSKGNVHPVSIWGTPVSEVDDL